jgi:hypothetical protein
MIYLKREIRRNKELVHMLWRLERVEKEGLCLDDQAGLIPTPVCGFVHQDPHQRHNAGRRATPQG